MKGKGRTREEEGGREEGCKNLNWYTLEIVKNSILFRGFIKKVR